QPTTTAASQVPARLAFPARCRGRAALAVQRPGQDARARRLPAPARAAEQVRVVHPAVADRLLQWLGDVLLPDHLGERLRAVPAVQGQRHAPTLVGLTDRRSAPAQGPCGRERPPAHLPAPAYPCCLPAL